MTRGGRPYSTEALRTSECPLCGREILVGDRIKHDGEWVHWTCPTPGETARCPVCCDVLDDGWCSNCEVTR